MISVVSASSIATYFDLLVWVAALAFGVVSAYEAAVQSKPTMGLLAIASSIVLLSISLSVGLAGMKRE